MQVYLWRSVGWPCRRDPTDDRRDHRCRARAGHRLGAKEQPGKKVRRVWLAKLHARRLTWRQGHASGRVTAMAAAPPRRRRTCRPDRRARPPVRKGSRHTAMRAEDLLSAAKCQNSNCLGRTARSSCTKSATFNLHFWQLEAQVPPGRGRCRVPVPGRPAQSIYMESGFTSANPVPPTISPARAMVL